MRALVRQAAAAVVVLAVSVASWVTLYELISFGWRR